MIMKSNMVGDTARLIFVEAVDNIEFALDTFLGKKRKPHYNGGFDATPEIDQVRVDKVMAEEPEAAE